MATHSSVLAWRILGTGEPGRLPSMGSNRVGHDWSVLAAVAAAWCINKFSLFQNTCKEKLNSKIPVLKVVVHDKMQIHKGWWLCHRCIISPHPTSSELSIYSLEIKLDFYQKIVIHFSWLPLFFPYFPFLFSGEKSLIYDYFNIIGKTWGKSLNNWRRWRHTFFPPIHDNRMWYMF